MLPFLTAKHHKSIWIGHLKSTIFPSQTPFEDFYAANQFQSFGNLIMEIETDGKILFAISPGSLGPQKPWGPAFNLSVLFDINNLRFVLRIPSKMHTYQAQ